MNHEHMHDEKSILVSFLLSLPFILAILVYILGTIKFTNRTWPPIRTLFWFIGVICIAATVVGPLAGRAHVDFVVHMINHLLLGMLGPLLLVLAAPMTLILRSLKVRTARKLTRVTTSKLVGLLSHPIIVMLLNLGGLWLLYTTDLYTAMHQNSLLYLMVHVHVFLAGYLFTLSMITIDPNPHQTSFRCRAIVLVSYLAGHGILSKYIYAFPTQGIPSKQAEIGGMLMYYGGDVIDVVIIFIFCLKWFRAARPRKVLIS